MLILAGTAAAPSAAQTPRQTHEAVEGGRLVRTSARPPADVQLFYQLLMGEMEWQTGRRAAAIDTLQDAARRAQRDDLFQRAADLALQAHAANRALAVVRAWRTSMPQSTQALRYEVQLLGALGRPAEAQEPVRQWLQRASESERRGIALALPRLFVRGEQAKAGAEMIEAVLQTPAAVPLPRWAALVTIGQAWRMAGDERKALARAQEAARDEPDASAPLLLALSLAESLPEAEALVADRLRQQRPIAPDVQMGYARLLVQQQRLSEAAEQLRQVTQAHPALLRGWLTLGAVELELRHPQAARQALGQYLERAIGSGPSAPPATATAGAEASAGNPDDDAPAGEDEAAVGIVQARLMLAQAAELLGDLAEAERQLGLIDDPARALEVQSRHAALLVRQGRWQEARERVRQVPAADDTQVRARLMAEVQVLRLAQQWQAAYELLGEAAAAQPDDTELLYEQAMIAEKLNRLDDMERLLRGIIARKPDHQHAYNALGYSLADRGQRLDEARQLIERALTLAPGDPFITDSLAWVAYRQGRLDEAVTLLQKAYRARPDVEIAAHLGEVLWKLGRQAEARDIWRAARQRAADNEVLVETLRRLDPGL
jgi:tetratricopeptide (TPR) repeat protein